MRKDTWEHFNVIATPEQDPLGDPIRFLETFHCDGNSFETRPILDTLFTPLRLLSISKISVHVADHVCSSARLGDRPGRYGYGGTCCND